MILTDMDGTLLNTKSVVSTGTRDVLKKIIAKDYKIVIATGRNYYEACKLTEDIPGLVYITANGSCIIDFNGREVFNKPLTKEQVLVLLDIMKKHPSLCYSAFSKEDIIVRNKDDYLNSFLFVLSQNHFQQELDLVKMRVDIKKREAMPLKEIEDLDILIAEGALEIQKFFVLGNSEDLAVLKTEINNKLAGQIKLSSSGRNNLEINAADISKGKALKLMAERYKIPLSQTIAFGDSQNDLELLDMAGIAVVMGNSTLESLREKADIIAESNDNDGVARVLSNLL